ncbi:MAG: MarR family winged helix-turn-helix transcriptional regulator [Pseudomonadota bacterium]
MMDVLGRWNAEMDERQSKTPFAAIRPADQRLFGQLRGRPVPMIALHKQLGITRQAAHNSILRLVEHGVVDIVSSPDNRKNKIVVVTEKGQQLRKLAAQSIQEIEADCAKRIGPERLELLRDILEELSGA